MKSRFILILLLVVSTLGAASCPFHKGLNLASWIWSDDGVENIPFSNYGKKDLENIKSLGCDVIRLPLSLLYFSDGEPDYTLDPLFFSFLDQVVTWAEELEIYLILDNHTQKSESSYIPLPDELLLMWVQLAERYKDRSEYILYEIMNEPHNIGTSQWYEGQKETIAAIREVDTVHSIVVAPIWNSITNLEKFVPYDFPDLIYAFHFYDPFLFTHQGATWANPQLINLANVPFPGRTGSIPECPEDLLGTYVENSLLAYPDYANVDEMYDKIDAAIDFSTKYDLPIFCDEFGVFGLQSPHADRVYWHRMITGYLTQNNIPWTLWGYKGNFGIMKKGTNRIFNRDLDPEMITALDMTMPDQDSCIVYPDSSGFVLYDESCSRHITQRNYTDDKNYNFYSLDGGRGKYCLKFQNPQQYDYVGFNFTLYRDIQYLKDQHALLSFLVKSDAPSIANLRLRFRDEAAPGITRAYWTASCTLHSGYAQWDNNWHRVEIPLSSFKESSSVQPAEDGQRFDWSRLNSLDIISHEYKLVGSHFYFDDVKIILPGEIVVTNPLDIPSTSKITNIWPNPFNHELTLSYSIENNSPMDLTLFDLQGKKVRTLMSKTVQSGSYELSLSLDGLAGGIYLIRLADKTSADIRKIIYLK